VVRFFFDGGDGGSSGWQRRQKTVVMDDGGGGQLDFFWTAVMAAAADGSGGSRQRMRVTATGHSGRQRFDFSSTGTAPVAAGDVAAVATVAGDDDILSEWGGEQCQ